MKFFDSCVYRVTPAEVAADIASDMAHERFLKLLSGIREHERLEGPSVTNHTNEDKEITYDDEATGRC